MILPLVLSVVFGLMIATKQFQSDSQLAKFSEWVSLILSLVGGWVLYTFYGQHLTVLNLGTNMGLRFTVDGLAVVFGGMVCLLWPIATHYAKTYMKHEGKFRRFFSFYILTFGVVLGLALSDNLFTLYLFYELLTIVTLPLVVHNERSRDFYAGRKYVAYMIFGAALTFSGMMLFISNVDTFQFTLGGTTPDILSAQLQWGYVLMFCGFGVKAGLFPFHGWLLAAGVAPTTVSSLLHAVAVVKSGAFAIMRVTFYLYDPEVLATTIVQPIVFGMTLVTVFFGSFMAMRSQHLKRRLAYSTISQLAYIVLGTVTMSILGLQAALLHMLFHGFSKIVLFYVSGNVIYTNGAHTVGEMRGYGYRMKTTMACFTICGLCLIGLPPFGGFFSKFGLAESLLLSETPGAIFGVIALIFSAFFTAVYIFEVVYIAYFPGWDYYNNPDIKAAPQSMRVTVVMITALMVVGSLMANEISTGIEFVLKGGV